MPIGIALEISKLIWIIIEWKRMITTDPLKILNGATEFSERWLTNWFMLNNTSEVSCLGEMPGFFGKVLITILTIFWNIMTFLMRLKHMVVSMVFW
jgi:hypothetical protein